MSPAPENVGAVVLTRNVGKPGDANDEMKILEAEDETNDLLWEDQYSLRATREFIRKCANMFNFLSLFVALFSFYI